MSAHDIVQPPFGVQILPDFQPNSRNGGVCSLSGLPKQRDELGKQPHEVDDFVVRLQTIEFEGGFDVREGALRELAATVLHMVPAAALETLTEALNQAEAARVSAQAALREAQAEFADLQLSESKLRVQNSELKDELRSALMQTDPEEAVASGDLYDLDELVHPLDGDS